MTDHSPTTFSGALRRIGRHAWAWADAPTERDPDIRDDHADLWNFRCRSSGGATYVEVLRGVAQETEALSWVIAGWRAGKYRAGQSGDHMGPMIISEGGISRAHILPGEDPLLGSEPLPEQPGPIPAAILVPAADWDAWIADQPPSGCLWPAEAEARILARAKALGWRDPREAR